MYITYFLMRASFAAVTCAFIVRRGLRHNSLDRTGALAAVLVGFVLTLGNFCFFSSLITFFLSSSRLTKFKSDIKREIEDDFREGGQRNWIQVFCNGGVASVLALLYIVDNGVGERTVDYAKDLNASLVCIAILGALSCSNGDTWASEIGSAIGSRTPRLITTFKKVPVGTNGAITVAGTLASIAGGALIGLAYYITQTACLAIVYRLGQPHYPPQWPIIMLGCIAGFVGSAVDSLLGATVQYSGYCSERKRVVYKPTSTSKHITGIGLLDNHLVNLVSSAITATITPVIGYYIWRTLSEAEGSAVYL